MEYFFGFLIESESVSLLEMEFPLALEIIEKSLLLFPELLPHEITVTNKIMIVRDLKTGMAYSFFRQVIYLNSV